MDKPCSNKTCSRTHRTRFKTCEWCRDRSKKAYKKRKRDKNEVQTVPEGWVACHRKRCKNVLKEDTYKFCKQCRSKSHERRKKWKRKARAGACIRCLKLHEGKNKTCDVCLVALRKWRDKKREASEKVCSTCLKPHDGDLKTCYKCLLAKRAKRKAREV